MDNESQDWEDQVEYRAPGEVLMVDLAGYEGPIDVLLQLAREQKVDLSQISILALAEQYLEFVRAARRIRLELAADYLVMAAWLAYLKSKLLLPSGDEDGEPSGAELAAALRFRLQRLEAMQEAGALLIKRPKLGEDRFPRGETSAISVTAAVVYKVTLYDLLNSYGRNKVRAEAGAYRPLAMALYSVDDAISRLKALLGEMPDWRDLVAFLPQDLRDGMIMRSAMASHFVASLEMVKEGALEIRQEAVYGPIFLRARAEKRAGEGDDNKGQESGPRLRAVEG